MSRFCQVFHVSVPVHPSSLPCATMARPERSRIKCKFSSISQQKRHEWYNLFPTTQRRICVARKGETFQPAKAETSVQGAWTPVGSGHWTPRIPAHVASETGTGGVGRGTLKSSASPTVTRWNANLVRRDDMPEPRVPASAKMGCCS